MLAQRLRQAVTLTNGQRIGFAEYGAPTGRRLFYLHGTPSSRLETGSWNTLCTRLNIRMIVPDRPGMGLSTPLPNRTIADYPSDIQQLARHLRWDSFDLLGGSGGAPYVMACARFLPPASLRRIGVIAGSGPPEAGNEGLSLLARLAGPTLLSRPWLVEWMFKGEARRAQSEDKAGVERSLKRAFARLSEADRQECERDFEWIVAGYREALAQGAAGVAWDMYLMLRPWGFRIKDIAHEGVQVWCGSRDKNTPIAMSKYMASRLPNADLHVMDGLTHYSIFSERHMEGILRDFVGL